MSKCTCRTDLEAQLLALFIKREPDAADHRVGITGYGFVITDKGMDTRGYIEVKATATHTAKNGNKKAKTVTQSMFFSYCPFCGVALTDAATEAKEPSAAEVPA